MGSTRVGRVRHLAGARRCDGTLAPVQPATEPLQPRHGRRAVVDPAWQQTLRVRRVIGEYGIDARVVECVRHLRQSERARQRHGEHFTHMQGDVRECPGHAILGQQCMALGAAGAHPLQLVLVHLW